MTSYTRARSGSLARPQRTILILSLLILCPGLLPAQAPANDACVDAVPVGFGSFGGETTFSTPDGSSACDFALNGPDNWYSITMPEDQLVFVESADHLGMVLSVHSSCPGIQDNELVCHNSVPAGMEAALVSFTAVAGQTYYLRVTTTDDFDGLPQPGSYFARVGPGGVIRGQVTDAEGQPIPDLEMLIFGSGPSIRTQTDESGAYEFRDRLSGQQQVFAGVDSPYVTEVWNNIPCPHLECNPGTPVETVIDSVTANIDFALDLGAAITGTVRDAQSGEPLEGIAIQLTQQEVGTDPLELITTTDALGSYRFEGLDAGSYAVFSALAPTYRPILWDGVPCSSFTCDPETATPIVLDRGDTAAGTDFVLDQGTTISGRVSEAGTGLAIPFERILLLDENGVFAKLDHTDGNGQYSFGQLNPGTYFVRTDAELFLDLLWPDVPCTLIDECSVAGATTIDVDLGQPAAGIDFQLAIGGLLQGQVFGQGLALPTGPILRLFDEAGSLLADTLIVDGYFEILGLAAGSYRALVFDPDGEYRPEVYDRIDCPGDVETCDPLAGTPIEVRTGGSPFLEIFLERNPTCIEDAETLCLTGGRFAVQATWSSSVAGDGQAQAVPIDSIHDSGAFWFFGPDNTEVVVKVLDACDSFQRFWVFAAGLTNVQVNLTVTDTETGVERAYFNPSDTAFSPIQDTNAFDTCGAGGGYTSSVAPNPKAELTSLEDQLRSQVRRGQAGSVAGPKAPGRSASCQAGFNTLCLGDGDRFQVEAMWRTPMGGEGQAVALPFAIDTGMFWFFGPNNVELIVKVLDACADPFRHFWVFAAGLTNVEVTLKVTDTQTGAVRTYFNPINQSFQPLLDTQAFATCP